MKKEAFVTLLILCSIILVFPVVSAINIKIDKQSADEVYVRDLKKPIIFDINITNLGSSDTFTFYNLIGFIISPDRVSIAQGESKNLRIEITPLSELPLRGYYTLPYFIKASDGTEVEQSFTFRIIDLKDAFLIGSSDIDVESSNTEIYIKNVVNFNFGEVNAVFKSPFFNVERRFFLGPKETKTITIQLNKEDFKTLTAGFYPMTAEITTYGTKTLLEDVIKFVEKNIVTTTKKEYGFFVNTQIIEKINEGNLVGTSETVIKKNIISRLFTTFSPEPDIVERRGFIVYYSWISEINPGEIYKITIRTNWLFPLIIILLLIAIVLLVKQYTLGDLILSKRVAFVKAKGGEFALKISIIVNARRYVEKVTVTDRVPLLAEIYERFGGEQPSNVDKKTKKIEWKFDSLQAGETRVLSYIIYSKVGVVGRFALPKAFVVYEREGRLHETESNHAFFIAEQREKDLPEK
ncbi:MAG: hypothetical protein QXX55_01925 [Candidatus Pacearchaeota archaeon]